MTVRTPQRLQGAQQRGQRAADRLVGAPDAAEAAGHHHQGLARGHAQLRARGRRVPGPRRLLQLVELGAARHHQLVCGVVTHLDEEPPRRLAEDGGAIGARAVRLVRDRGRTSSSWRRRSRAARPPRGRPPPGRRRGRRGPIRSTRRRGTPPPAAPPRARPPSPRRSGSPREAAGAGWRRGRLRSGPRTRTPRWEKASRTAGRPRQRGPDAPGQRRARARLARDVAAEVAIHVDVRRRRRRAGAASPRAGRPARGGGRRRAARPPPRRAEGRRPRPGPGSGGRSSARRRAGRRRASPAALAPEGGVGQEERDRLARPGRGRRRRRAAALAAVAQAFIAFQRAR